MHPRLADGKVDYSRLVSCRCQADRIKRESQEHYLRYCKLPANTGHMTFDNFKDYGEKDLKNAYKLSRSLAEGEKGVLWLTLLAENDRSKTHLAVAICRRWIERGFVARFAVTSELLDELRDSFDMEGEYSFHWKIKMFYEVSLLVLDELGMGKYTDWGREQIFKIVNHRANAGLPLVVTSNNEIDKMFGEHKECELDNARLESRLQRESWCHVAIIGGPAHMMRK